jgi:PKD domain
MVFQKKKTSFLIALLFLMTAFVGLQSAGVADEAILLAEAGGPYQGEECYPILLNASGSYAADGLLVTYRWNIEGSWIENGNYPYMEWTWYDDFSGEILLEVSDGTNLMTDVALVTVENVAPQIVLFQGPTEVDVGSEFSYMVDFFDGLADPRSPTASLDTFTATFSWDDGMSTELVLAAGEFSTSASHVYDAAGLYRILITIVDSNGGEAQASMEIMAGEIALVEAGPDGTVPEGSLFQSSGFLADADSTTYTALVDYYDETGAFPLSLNPGNTFDLSHVYAEDGIYDLLVTVFNDGMEYGSDTAMVTVTNVPPSIESLSVSPSNPYKPGDVFELSVLFSDPGVLDAHTVEITWGDGSSTTFTTEAGVAEARESHSYKNAGNYQISVTLTDDDGGVASGMMTVEVKNPAPSMDGIKELILGLRIPRGLKNTLLSILDNVPHFMRHQMTHAVVHQLQAFIHYVEAQSGRHLPRDQARELIQTARLLIDSLSTR